MTQVISLAFRPSLAPVHPPGEWQSTSQRASGWLVGKAKLLTLSVLILIQATPEHRVGQRGLLALSSPVKLGTQRQSAEGMNKKEKSQIHSQTALTGPCPG